jgi:hypothetical protein
MRVPTLVLLALLSACGGGGGASEDRVAIGPIHCAGLSGATHSVTINCPAGCSVEFPEAAMDGDLDTYAVLATEPNASGTAGIRATAAEGVTYEAGTPAAVVFGVERTGDVVSNTQTIATYLDGAARESQATGDTNVVGGGDEPPRRSTMSTTMSFDAIELTYAQTGGTATTEVQIHEFCTSAN